MAEYIEVLRTFLINYPALQYIVIFLGSGFGGETAVIMLSVLAAQEIFPLATFFIISFFAVVFSDTIWFILGRTKTVGAITDHRYATNTIFVLTQAIEKISRGNMILALTFVKFLIGTRVVLIFYISKTKISVKDFTKYNLIAIFIWLVVLIPIGYLSELGYTYFSSILESIYGGIGFILLILILFIAIQIWLKRIFTKEGQEIIEENSML